MFMKKITITAAILLCTVNIFSAQATVVDIDPGTGLIPIDGPYGFGGRGVVIRAENDFSMTNLAMEGTWGGLLDFAVQVYDLNTGSRGALLSETSYASQAAQAGAWFDFDHNYNFTMGNQYEIMMQFSSPGIAFTHYNFDNGSLTIANGVLVDPSILLLDGSDFDNGHAGNSWTPNFKLTIGAADVPEPAPMALLGLGLLGLGLARRRTRT